jgi:hypothetical protein
MGQGAQQAERSAAALRVVGPGASRSPTSGVRWRLTAALLPQDGDGIIWPWDVFVRLHSLTLRPDSALSGSQVQLLTRTPSRAVWVPPARLRLAVVHPRRLVRPFLPVLSFLFVPRTRAPEETDSGFTDRPQHHFAFLLVVHLRVVDPAPALPGQHQEHPPRQARFRHGHVRHRGPLCPRAVRGHLFQVGWLGPSSDSPWACKIFAALRQSLVAEPSVPSYRFDHNNKGGVTFFEALQVRSIAFG